MRRFRTHPSRALLALAQSADCSDRDLRAISAELAERKNDVALEVYLEVGRLLEAREKKAREDEASKRSAAVSQAARRRADGYFDWPSTDAPAARYGFVGDCFHYRDGLFSYVGYHVGRTGLPVPVRQQTLDCVFHNVLPRVNSPEYMESWGSPRSAARLQKMAESLAAFARNAKRNTGADFSDAIEGWEHDLRYLYEQYYVMRFRFVWPDS